MSLSNNERDKIQPGPLVSDPAHLLALAIVVLQIIIAIGVFPFLPSVVPTHWNAAGQVDKYSSKWVNTILFPALGISIYLVLRFVSALGPRLGGRDSKAANAQIRMTLLVIVLLFLLVVQLCITAISLGVAIGMAFVLNLALALLFIGFGNFMGKTRRNFWMGIRTPWTLSSDLVWERTHRIGGWLFVLIGLLGLPCSFLPPLRPWGLLGMLLVIVVFLYFYSYWCYRKNTVEGHEPVSPPFDEAGLD